MNRKTIQKTKEIYSSKLHKPDIVDEKTNKKSRPFFTKILDKLDEGIRKV